jgi:hypothetical protein
VGTWYWIGVSVGIGVAFGVFQAGFWGEGRSSAFLIPVETLAVGFGLGWLVSHWEAGMWGDRGGAVAGAALGLIGAVPVVVGALRRGGTRGGTVALLCLAGLALAGLAFVPALGYVEAVVLPALGVLLRRKQPERYAGLRTLAKD